MTNPQLPEKTAAYFALLNPESLYKGENAFGLPFGTVNFETLTVAQAENLVLYKAPFIVRLEKVTDAATATAIVAKEKGTK
jgi:hypothetical protein